MTKTFLVKLWRKLRGAKVSPPLLYDLSRSERIVEYGWVLTNMREKPRRVLDIGCWNSLFPIQLASLGYRVLGIDMREYPYSHPNFEFVRGDILDAKIQKRLAGKSFDTIILVSTLEHIGLLFRTDDSVNFSADLELLRFLSNQLLSKDGEILLTVPFGRPKVLKRDTVSSIDLDFSERTMYWQKIYDANSINTLADKCSLTVTRSSYFIERKGYYVPTDLLEAEASNYPRKSVSCIKLMRKEE